MAPSRLKITIGAICAALIVGTCVWVFAKTNRAPLSQREIATQTLAEYVRKTVKPRSVLIVSNPYSPMSGRSADAYKFQKAGEAGLRKGFGEAVDVKVGFPKLKPDALRDVGSVFVDPTVTTPLSYLISDNAIDDLIREHPECDVLVSLIGVPANSLPIMSGPKRFAFLLPDFKIVGDPNLVRQAFKSGKVIAAVIAKPGAAQVQATSGSDYKREFEKRFILVTPENIDQMLPLLLR